MSNVTCLAIMKLSIQLIHFNWHQIDWSKLQSTIFIYLIQLLQIKYNDLKKMWSICYVSMFYLQVIHASSVNWNVSRKRDSIPFDEVSAKKAIGAQFEDSANKNWLKWMGRKNCSLNSNVNKWSTYTIMNTYIIHI